MADQNGVHALAEAFRDVISDALRPVEGRLCKVEDRLEKVEADVAVLKGDVAVLKGDTKQIIEILTSGRP